MDEARRCENNAILYTLPCVISKQLMGVVTPELPKSIPPPSFGVSFVVLRQLLDRFVLQSLFNAAI